MKEKKCLSDEGTLAVIEAHINGHSVKKITNGERLKVTKEIEEKIKMLYESGSTYRQVAEQVRISSATTLRVLKKCGVTLRINHPPSVEQKLAIVSLYNEGDSTRTISRKLNIPDSTVYSTLVASNVEMRSGRTGIEKHSKIIIELYESGMSMEKISNKLGFIVGTVYNLLKREGVKLRSQKETTLKNWQNAEYANSVNSKRPDQTGQKSHRWKGGRTALSTIIRTSKKYSEWRFTVFSRDNFTCQHCGKTTSELPRNSIQADHKYPFSKILDDHSIASREQAMACDALWSVDNGQTLCNDCHKKTPTYGINAQYYTSPA